MTDTVGLLLSVLRESGARSVIDLGCGDGTIAAALGREGFAVTGVDPSAAMLERARRQAPEATFVQAKAEEVEGTARFDAGVFVNALHHVAPDSMGAALRRAVEIVRPFGPVVVIEPLPEGTFVGAMRPVEDETAIRRAAARAVDTAVADGLLALRDVHRWERQSRFDGIGDFVDCLTRVVPERADLARENAGALARAWEENATRGEGQALLVQPMIAWVLAAP